MVWRATMVFVAAIVTAATLWSMLVIGLGGGDAEVPGLLTSRFHAGGVPVT